MVFWYHLLLSTISDHRARSKHYNPSPINNKKISYFTSQFSLDRGKISYRVQITHYIYYLFVPVKNHADNDLTNRLTTATGYWLWLHQVSHHSWMIGSTVSYPLSLISDPIGDYLIAQGNMTIQVNCKILPAKYVVVMITEYLWFLSTLTCLKGFSTQMIG